ncbi:MAG: glycosyltransferase family 2 protein [Lachnospiraceae bacterium]|nr:glycosyltransferase family 2 protein [Lachnospiraceae bacterium]
MLEKKLVSIIIPTHNVGDYIGATIDCLLRQTYSDIEIIVVDYESSDETARIAYSYEDEASENHDSRVLYIPTKEAGVSTGRNLGLAEAHGSYVIFMDGDDLVEPDYVEYLMAQMTPDVALASCGYDMMADGETLYASPESTTRVLSREDMLCRLFYLINDQGYVWNKIFRRDIIEEFQLRFQPDLYYGEDRAFLVDYILHIERVRMAPKHLYHYQMRPDSAMDELRESREDVTRMSPERLDRQATEVKAYLYMKKALRKYPDAKWLCSQVAVYTALQLYQVIEESENPSIYRRCVFRKYIRKLRRVEYFGDEEDLMLQQYMNAYGRTGRVML